MKKQKQTEHYGHERTSERTKGWQHFNYQIIVLWNKMEDWGSFPVPFEQLKVQVRSVRIQETVAVTWTVPSCLPSLSCFIIIPGATWISCFVFLFSCLIWIISYVYTTHCAGFVFSIATYNYIWMVCDSIEMFLQGLCNIDVSCASVGVRVSQAAMPFFLFLEGLCYRTKWIKKNYTHNIMRSDTEFGKKTR